MDRKTTIQELKNRVQKFCDDRDWGQFHAPKDLSIGIISEASELLEPFRFKTLEQQMEIVSNPRKRKAVGDELADTIFLLLRFAQKYGFDVDEEMKKKIKNNAQRYPVSTSKGSNKKYNEA